MSYNIKDKNDNFRLIDSAINDNQLGNFYVFHGDEHYLRDRYIEKIRKFACPDGIDGFNYRRFEGANLTIPELSYAIDTLPVFSDKTLIEIHDFNIFQKSGSSDEGEEDTSVTTESDTSKTEPILLGILSNLPDYVCLLIIYNTIEFKPDKRKKVNKEILKNAQVIEFAVQNQSDLFKWVTKHYKHIGKRIGRPEVEYLVHITGGYMATLKNEIEKTAAHSKSDYITRADIDAVVVPVLDAIIYQLTDSIIKRENHKAMQIFDELLRMREIPQKLIFSISLKMRQLLAARICVETNPDKKYLMDICGIRYDFQAKMLMDTARKTSLDYCRQAVVDCADAAFDINCTSDPESRLLELVMKLTLN